MATPEWVVTMYTGDDPTGLLYVIGGRVYGKVYLVAYSNQVHRWSATSGWCNVGHQLTFQQARRAVETAVADDMLCGRCTGVPHDEYSVRTYTKEEIEHPDAPLGRGTILLSDGTLHTAPKGARG